MAKTTDLAPVAGTVVGTDLMVPQMGATASDLLYAVTNGMKLRVEDTSDATEADFLARTLTSNPATEEELLNGGGLTKLEDVLNIPLKITAYNGLRNVDPAFWDNSALGVYAVVELTDRDGQTFTVAVGSSQAVSNIIKLNDLGWIPQKGWTVFEKSAKATRGGFYPINMRSVADPTF